jgi:hypothetical protein
MTTLISPKGVPADSELPEDVLPVPAEVLMTPIFARNADEVTDNRDDFSHS